MQCSEFKAKLPNERKSFVEINKLCFNCFGTHLIAKCQSIKTCVSCKSRHYSLLHDAYQFAASNEASSLSVMRPSSERKAIFFATACVNIADHLGRPQAIRDLTDQGSEVSLIAEALAQRLRLPRTRSSLAVVRIGEARSGATRGKILLVRSNRCYFPCRCVHSATFLYVFWADRAKQSHLVAYLQTPTGGAIYLKQDPVELLLAPTYVPSFLKMDSARIVKTKT